MDNDKLNSSRTEALVLHSHTAPFDKLFLQLNHNRGKQRIEACKSLIPLIPSLNEEQSKELLVKLSDLAHTDGDLDVRLQACLGLRELALTFINHEMIDKVIDTLNAAFEKMKDHEEITYDPDQSWVIQQIECLTVGKLAVKLSNTERGNKILEILIKYSTDQDHHVSAAAQESLDFVSKAKLTNVKKF